ncbi:MAG: glycosyltransferase family 2 protein [Lachnospiraceae bacterium]
MKVSFVIPCYRSAQTLPGVVAEIKETMATMPEYSYELILVNDCSTDDTFETIRRIASENPNVTGVNLARNFGQHAALMAGFHEVSGDVIVCLDDDGQTPANEVGKLLDGIRGGSDVVYARYTNKKHSAFRNFGSRVNDWMTRVMLGKPKDLYVSSYFAARRFVVDNMLQYEHSYPYVIGLVLRATKNIINVDVTHREREIGTSGYTMKKLLALWFNGFTAFSIKPLRIATVLGCITAACGFLYGIYTVIKKFVNPDVPIGFSAMMSALVFIGGMIMLMLGMIGEYIGRMYISMNRSPQFVVRERVGENASESERGIYGDSTFQPKKDA